MQSLFESSEWNSYIRSFNGIWGETTKLVVVVVGCVGSGHVWVQVLNS